MGFTPAGVGLADLNLDGKPDLVSTNVSSGTASVLLGRGDGTFDPKAEYGVGRGPTWVSIRDLSGDWLPDLVVATRLSNTISTLLNTAPPTTSVSLVRGERTPVARLAPAVPNPARSDLAIAFWLPAGRTFDSGSSTRQAAWCGPCSGVSCPREIMFVAGTARRTTGPPLVPESISSSCAATTPGLPVD